MARPLLAEGQGLFTGGNRGGILLLILGRVSAFADEFLVSSLAHDADLATFSGCLADGAEPGATPNELGQPFALAFLTFGPRLIRVSCGILAIFVKLAFAHKRFVVEFGADAAIASKFFGRSLLREQVRILQTLLLLQTERMRVARLLHICIQFVFFVSILVEDLLRFEAVVLHVVGVGVTLRASFVLRSPQVVRHGALTLVALLV